MNSKSLLIAIAAFAVSATGAQAYVGSSALNRAGLSVEQIHAFEEARVLRASGDVRKARDVLVKAGVDDETITHVRSAASEARLVMEEALKANNFAAFKAAVADTPLDDVITSKVDFKLFKEAHDLRRVGEHQEANEIFVGLGLDRTHKRGHGLMHNRGLLTTSQHSALQAARQANDSETVKAILSEAGWQERQGVHQKGW